MSYHSNNWFWWSMRRAAGAGIIGTFALVIAIYKFGIFENKPSVQADWWTPVVIGSAQKDIEKEIAKLREKKSQQ